MLGKKSFHLIAMRKSLSSEFWMAPTTKIIYNTYSDMSTAKLMQVLESWITVMCWQRSLVYITTLREELPLKEFSLTDKESKAHGKRANKSKVKMHHLTLSSVRSLQGKMSDCEQERPYEDVAFLFAT